MDHTIYIELQEIKQMVAYLVKELEANKKKDDKK